MSSYIAPIRISVGEHIEMVRRRLAAGGQAKFSELIDECGSKIEVIATFLAILELCKRGEIAIGSESCFGEIFDEDARGGRRAVSPDDSEVTESGAGADSFWEERRSPGRGSALRSGARVAPGAPAVVRRWTRPRVVEALLFVSPEPLSVGAISEVTGFDAGAVREMLNRLVESYSVEGRAAWS